jgi:uncharacterized protein
MIIDCHTHIFPPEMRSDRKDFCKKDKGFSALYGDPRSKMAGVEELIDSMDEAGVDQSVVCGFPWSDPDCCSLHNHYLMESASRYPRRLIVFISLPFSNPDWSEKEFDQRRKEGAKGVGEAAFYCHEMTSRDIESMRPILVRMEKEGVPLLLHTNERIGHSYPGKGETPLERFYDLVATYPRLSVILAHWGGGLAFYELMPEVARVMSQVYYDTAASPYIYSKKIYSITSQIVGPERIVFGSDFPLIRPKRYFQEIEESGLSSEDQKNILGLNFLKLLKL